MKKAAKPNNGVSAEQARKAVRTLLRYAGDDPTREGLLDTPDRVARAWAEWFGGYHQQPDEVLAATFTEVGGYSGLVQLNGLRLYSHCEHHLAPIVGTVTIAYLPSGKVVGLSKLQRLVDVYGRRLQVQEKLTAQLADAMHHVLQPRGVAVVVRAEHFCMSSRGTCVPGVQTVTSELRGVYLDDASARNEILHLLGL